MLKIISDTRGNSTKDVQTTGKLTRNCEGFSFCFLTDDSFG